ncbi:hypothetical protein [Brevibacillus gelatini]
MKSDKRGFYDGLSGYQLSCEAQMAVAAFRAAHEQLAQKELNCLECCNIIEQLMANDEREMLKHVECVNMTTWHESKIFGSGSKGV